MMCLQCEDNTAHRVWTFWYNFTADKCIHGRNGCNRYSLLLSYDLCCHSKPKYMDWSCAVGQYYGCIFEFSVLTCVQKYNGSSSISGIESSCKMVDELEPLCPLKPLSCIKLLFYSPLQCTQDGNLKKTNPGKEGIQNNDNNVLLGKKMTISNNSILVQGKCMHLRSAYAIHASHLRWYSYDMCFEGLSIEPCRVGDIMYGDTLSSILDSYISWETN